MSSFYTGASAPSTVISGTADPYQAYPSGLLGRAGVCTVSVAIDNYMAAYSGRDDSRATRLRWWQHELGQLQLHEVDQDHIFHALEALVTRKPSIRTDFKNQLLAAKAPQIKLYICTRSNTMGVCSPSSRSPSSQTGSAD